MKKDRVLETLWAMRIVYFLMGAPRCLQKEIEDNIKELGAL